MRLARLDLTRYGRFTDVKLEFPAGACDFHVIYGDNEAGKSTTRNALAELLFGYEARTPYAFLHEYADLQLGARLESDIGALDIVRYKRTKSPLVDTTGQPVDSVAWRQLLGTTDRVFFERMFALDHEQLVKGGQSMLDARTDVGRALFQAAAGLGHFSKVRANLANEASQWWASRSRKDVRFYVARTQMEQASRALRDHQLSESALKTLLTASQQAHARAQAAGVAQRGAHARLAQLERIRRVAPKLQQLAAAREECSRAAHIVLLPADARERFRTTGVEIVTAQSAHSQLLRTIEEQSRRRDALVVEELLLAHADEIDDLVADLSSFEGYVTDLPKRKVEREQLRRDIHSGLADLGIPGLDPNEVATRLPTVAQREQLRALADEHDQQSRLRTTRAERLETAQESAAAHQRELDRLGADVDASWDELIAAGEAVLEDINVKQLRATLAEADAQVRLALSALHWGDALEPLRAIQPPDIGAIRCAVATLAQQRVELNEQSRSHREAAAELAKIGAQLAAPQQSAVPEAGVLAEARGRRDALLKSLLQGTAEWPREGVVLRDQIQTTDDLVDRRYAAAQDAALRDKLALDRSGEEARITVLAEQIEAMEKDAETLREQWAQALASAGLPPMELESVEQWLGTRLRVLELSEKAERDRDQLVMLSAEAERLTAPLAASLNKTVPAGAAIPETLKALLVEARTAQKAATERRVRRIELQRLLDDQKAIAARETQAIEALDTAIVHCGEAWESACVAAGIPVDTPPKGLDRVLSTVEAVRTKVESFAREQQSRIQPMEKNIRLYEERLRACLAQVADELTSRQTAEAVRALSARLTAARGADQSRREIDASLERQRIELEDLEVGREAAAAKLIPLMRVAGVQSTEALDAAIAESDRRRALELAYGTQLNVVLELGDGLDLASLQAEVTSIDLAEINGLLHATTQEYKDAQEKEHAALKDAALADEKLRQRKGSDDAARAHIRKVAAQREMTDAAEAYIGLHTQTLLLDWALARYREEKQAPLLQRASEYFADLTCGEHVRLLADGEGEGITLSSRRAGPGNLRVPIDGMSDGTRDQLYLALRLAAVDLHLANNLALPFVADDLLVNFDDTRSRAAITGLSRLAQRTQTLYFTHHRHLLDLARTSVPGVNVIELGA